MQEEQQRKNDELNKIVTFLKAFRPHNIALEVVKEDSDTLNKSYQDYLKGNIPLSGNEVHQFGFRTAAELGHERVHAVDWMENVGNISAGQVLEWAEKEQRELYTHITKNYMDKLQLDMTHSSLFDLIFKCHSSSRIRQEHEMYMAVARAGKGVNYVGIDWLRWWYQRNLIIFSNVAEITTQATDRTLLIISAAHIYLVNLISFWRKVVCLKSSHLLNI